MPIASPPRPFVLGHSGVQAGEVAQIKALLTFARTRTHADWLFGNDEPPDVLLIGSDAAAAAPPSNAQRHCIKVHLLEPGHPLLPGETLLRPLHFDTFTALLIHLEATLFSQVERTQAPSATTETQAPPQPAQPEVDRSHVFRLKRWPPVSVLSADRYHPRLASFLSARAMGLDELSRISGASLEHCQRFLSLVSQLGLVEISDRKSAASDAPAQHRDATHATASHHGAAPAKSEPHSSHGLIAMIRLHLGI